MKLDLTRPLQTRNGRRVTIIKKRSPNVFDYPVVGLIDGETEEQIWTSDGHFWSRQEHSEWDLVYAPPAACCDCCDDDDDEPLPPPLVTGVMYVDTGGTLAVGEDKTPIYRQYVAVALTDDILEVLTDAGYDTTGLG